MNSIFALHSRIRLKGNEGKRCSPNGQCAEVGEKR